MFNIHKFIDLIRDRPSLWNKNDAGYNDNINRDLAWYEIGESMFDDWLQRSVVDREEQGKMFREKWRHLRDNYTKSKKIKNKKKPYVYSERLKFLNGVVGHKNDSDNSHISSKKKIEDDEKDTHTNGHIGSGSNIGNDIIYEATENCASDTIEDTYQDLQPSLPPAKKLKNTNQPTVSPNKLHNLRPREPISESRQQTANLVEANFSIQDPDFMFFNSLLPEYKPPAKKLKNTNQSTVSPNKLNNLRPREPTSESRQQTANLVESNFSIQDPDLMFLNSLQYKLNNLRPREPTSESRQQTANLVEANFSIQDPDFMFFNSLLPDYKELDEEEKLDFRIKCLQFIQDIRKSRKS